MRTKEDRVGDVTLALLGFQKGMRVVIVGELPPDQSCFLGITGTIVEERSLGHGHHLVQIDKMMPMPWDKSKKTDTVHISESAMAPLIEEEPCQTSKK